MAAGGLDQYLIAKSLRFNDDDTAYLNRTPSSSTTNQKQFTLSFWMKRGQIEQGAAIFHCGANTSTTGYISIFLDSTDDLHFLGHGGLYLITSALYRDPSAWYHFVIAVDTTQTTDLNKLKLYVNGVQDTNWSLASWCSDDKEYLVNTNTNHEIGVARGGTGALYYYFDGLMAEWYCIDGQTLTASDFGETNADTGQWIPKEYSGSYGTNGFYLNFDGDGKNYTSEISGSEQTPATYPKEKMFDGNPATAYLVGDSSTATWTPVGGLTFDSTLKLRAYHTATGTSNSDVTFNWSGGSYTLVIDDVSAVKYYDVSSNVTSPVTSVTWTTDAASAGPYIYGVEVDGKVLVDRTGIESDSSGSNNHWTANNLVADTSFGILTGSDDNTPQKYATGAFSGATAATANFHRPNGNGNNEYLTWTPSAPHTAGSTLKVYLDVAAKTGTRGLYVNGSDVDSHVTVTENTPVTNVDEWSVDLSAASITEVTSVATPQMSSGTAYLHGISIDGTYVADYGLGVDQSTDTPTTFDDEGNGTGNYATLNPLENEAGTPCTLSQGNLGISVTSTGHVRSTIGMSSGEWYCEYTHGTGLGMIGLADGETETAFYLGQATKGNGYGYYSTGTTYGNDTGGAAYGASYTTGDVIGVAFDADAGTLTFYKNNTSQGTAFTSLTSGPYFFAVGVDTMADAVMNFGQRPFAYTPPSGYLALNTYNLNTTTTLSGTYEGNGDADGPVIWMNATPATLRISSTNDPPQAGDAVTFSPTTVDPLANGFKIRHASTNNVDDTTYYWLATTNRAFKYANAQSNE